MDEEAAASRSLQGLRVVAFESRRAVELAELIRRHGGIPVSAPSMREVPRDSNRELLEYLGALEAGEVDVVLMLTGVGLRTLVKQVERDWPRDRLSAALRRATIVARGPKPVAALRELGLQPNVTVPEPNTWRELLATLDEKVPVRAKRVAVQEYGVTNPELLHGLEVRGAVVRRIAIYSWALPEDLGPLHAGITAILDGAAAAVLFTSANQVYTLFRVAENMSAGNTARLRTALNHTIVASIGPVCSVALREHGIEPDLEPEHPKMGHLVSTLAKRAHALGKK